MYWCRFFIEGNGEAVQFISMIPPGTIPTHCADCNSVLVRKFLPAQKSIKDGFYFFRCPEKKNECKGKSYRDVV